MTSPERSRGWAGIAAFLTMSVALTSIGCAHVSGYVGYWERHRQMAKAFHERASAGLFAQLHPEDCYLLVGDLAFDRPYQGPILVVAVTDKYQPREIVAQRIIAAPVDHYEAYLPEAVYDLYFFADVDEDGFFDSHEMVGRTNGAPIKVDKASIKDNLTSYGPALTLTLSRVGRSELPIKVQVRDQAHVFATLDDPFFDPTYGRMGLYNPQKWLAHTQRFFFSLEDLDPSKTIVIFVHGIAGTPRDFKYLVDGLDRTRYQAWFYFYPTGMPLQKVGSLLADIIRLASKEQTYRLNRVIVVAHSMGGLVSLSALNELCREGMPSYLRGYVSFDSPYGGVEQRMIDKVPVVVPSWTDIGIGSPFLEQLYRGDALKKLPFYLFFGYKTGDSTDGTITLQSQLEPRVQRNAFKSYGFNTTHEGILNDPASRELFYGTLATLAQQQ